MRNARELSIASVEAVKAKRREEWLDIFADDAVVEDPVGPSPNDPEGKGHRGRDEIGRFWDVVIGRHKSFDYEIKQSYLCGNEVANALRLIILTQEDRRREFDVIVVYRANADGKLESLRAFWEFPKAG